ncbi:hypothetical protein X975_16445, partial [Stegodyphus mimosarum]
MKMCLFLNYFGRQQDQMMLHQVVYPHLWSPLPLPYVNQHHTYPTFLHGLKNYTPHLLVSDLCVIYAIPLFSFPFLLFDWV